MVVGKKAPASVKKGRPVNTSVPPPVESKEKQKELDASTTKRESKSKRVGVHKAPGGKRDPSPAHGRSSVSDSEGRNTPTGEKKRVMKKKRDELKANATTTGASPMTPEDKRRKKKVVTPVKKPEFRKTMSLRSPSSPASPSRRLLSGSQTPRGNATSSPSPRKDKLNSPTAREAFKRTATLPVHSNAARANAASPIAPQRLRGNSTIVAPQTRLDEGLPLGIPTGLLPAADMPPRDVLMDTFKRKAMLLKICQELEDSLPHHLKTIDVSEEGKRKAVRKKKGPEENAKEDERKPVTSKFLRKILILFYASRNEAEECRCRLERAVHEGIVLKEWPPSITCMHASYNIIDALVRIGHRRVLKVLFGTLYWHILDVLEWPPQPFGGKVRIPHRTKVKAMQLPDSTVVPQSQIEDIIKLHRVMYVQNSCLVRACDSITYLALYEFIEAEKLRMIRGIIDSGYTDDRDPSFLVRWVKQWTLAPTSARRNELLASLMAVTTGVWEHDLTIPFTKKLQSLGIVDILINVLTIPSLASGAAEVLGVLASDPSAQKDLRQIFLGVTHQQRVVAWKKFIKATMGEGSKGIRELVQVILTSTDDMWDVMMYLQALEELSGDGFLQTDAEGVRNFCDSLNLLLLPLGRVFKEAFAGNIAAMVVSELAGWVKGVYRLEWAPTVASVLRTMTLLLRVPCREAAMAMKKLRVFENLVGFIPKKDCLTRAAALSLSRAVWWRADSSASSPSYQTELPDSLDMGCYTANDNDIRTTLQLPATKFLVKIGLNNVLQNVMNGENTLCASMHSKPGVRCFFNLRTHFE